MKMHVSFLYLVIDLWTEIQVLQPYRLGDRTYWYSIQITKIHHFLFRSEILLTRQYNERISKRKVVHLRINNTLAPKKSIKQEFWLK